LGSASRGRTRECGTPRRVGPASAEARRVVAIAAFLFFGERLRRAQIAGVSIAVGVAALSVLRL
jgi:hypothetical protein